MDQTTLFPTSDLPSGEYLLLQGEPQFEVVDLPPKPTRLVKLETSMAILQDRIKYLESLILQKTPPSPPRVLQSSVTIARTITRTRPRTQEGPQIPQDLVSTLGLQDPKGKRTKTSSSTSKADSDPDWVYNSEDIFDSSDEEPVSSRKKKVPSLLLPVPTQIRKEKPNPTVPTQTTLANGYQWLPPTLSQARAPEIFGQHTVSDPFLTSPWRHMNQKCLLGLSCPN